MPYLRDQLLARCRENLPIAGTQVWLVESVAQSVVCGSLVTQCCEDPVCLLEPV
jgi:hypothetical protein